GKFFPGRGLAVVDHVLFAHCSSVVIDIGNAGIETAEQICIDRFRIVVFREGDGPVFGLGIGYITIGIDEEVVGIDLHDIGDDEIVLQDIGGACVGGEEAFGVVKIAEDTHLVCGAIEIVPPVVRCIICCQDIAGLGDIGAFRPGLSKVAEGIEAPAGGGCIVGQI